MILYIYLSINNNSYFNLYSLNYPTLIFGNKMFFSLIYHDFFLTSENFRNIKLEKLFEISKSKTGLDIRTVNKPPGFIWALVVWFILRKVESQEQWADVDGEGNYATTFIYIYIWESWSFASIKLNTYKTVHILHSYTFYNVWMCI